jgi:hypothetical protein
VSGNAALLKQVLGPALPFSAAVLGAVAPLVAMTAAAKAAAEALDAIRNAQTLSGGRPQDIAALMGMGIAPNQIPGIAAALRERLGSDPFAMAAGGYVPGRPFGPTNEAEILRQNIEMLRRMGENEDQLRQARILGLDGILEQINVSREMRREQALTSEVQRRLTGDRVGTRAARDLAAGWANLNGAINNLKTALGKDAIPLLTRAINGIARLVNVVAAAWDTMPAWAKVLLFGMGGAALGAGAGMLVGQPGVGGLAGLVSGIVAGTFAVKYADKFEKATNRFGNAVDQFSAGLRSAGMYGGGERARKAIPAGWKGAQFSELVDRRALAMGAFGI